MNQIKCPHCNEIFTVDQASYADILSQVRNDAFQVEIHDKLESLKLIHEKELLEKQTSMKLELTHQLNEKSQELQTLKHQIDSFNQEKKLELLKKEAEAQALLNQKDQKLQSLETQIDVLKKEAEFNTQKLLSVKDQELMKVKNDLELQKNQELLEKNLLKETYVKQLELKDEEIQKYKDFKLKQSTKMMGETLELHCENEFNRIRMTSFPKATFSKDNDASTGSKGDYIYREVDENGVELLSIMFEMKNEGDETATKKKNKDFFKELDKDRNEKRCEYAILVSLLESDSELYNGGIVDVSYEYKKMFVIRPQFFIPIISLLRNASLNALSYKQEVEVMRKQNIDVTNFEKDLNDFKEAFSVNYIRAQERFGKAIEEIDKTIDHLTKIKENLLASDRNLGLANKKAEDLTVKKLTRQNPTMKEKFDALKSTDES
jgi:hypothetical protein